ncbi:MAG: hypothetical protein ACOVQG_04925 [Crocinitomicaceae bacterium]|jgi:hypothetical protein
MNSHFAIFFILLSFFSYTQKKDTTFNIRYHSNKKISTKEVKLTNELNWGYAKAFDRNGKEIYSMSIRNAAGHSSVNFDYYPSGAVKKAHFTGHPDGGIQWDDVTHYFDENGIVTQVINNSSDDFGHYKLRIDPTLFSDTITKPNISPLTGKETPKKQEVVACAEIYSTEFYLINASGKKRNVVARLLNAPIDGFQKEVTFANNDTIKLGNYIEAQLFTHPKERVSLEIKGRKSEKFQLFWEEPKQEGKSKRIYFMVAVRR